MKSPKDLSFEDLVEIAEHAQCGLFLGRDSQGRLVWNTDMDRSGADFIEHVWGVLDKHDLVPCEVEPYESDKEDDGPSDVPEGIVVIVN